MATVPAPGTARLTFADPAPETARLTFYPPPAPYTAPPAGTAPLRFSDAYAPPPAGTAPLRFKHPGTVEEPTPEVQTRLYTRLPPPRALIRGYIPRLARLVARAPAARGQLRADWDVNVWRGPVHASRSPYHDAAPLPDGFAGLWGDSGRTRVQPAAPWGLGLDARRLWDGRWQTLTPRPRQPLAPWRDGRPLGSGAVGPWISLHRRHVRHAAPWQDGQAAGLTNESPWHEHAPRRRHHLDHWQEAAPAGQGWLGDWTPARRFDRRPATLPWQDARFLAGLSWPFVLVTPAPEEKPFCPPAPGTAYLLFSELATGQPRLVFADVLCKVTPEPPPPGVIIVPIRRVYIVPTAAYLRRLSDAQDIPAQSLSLQIDMDSWAWGFHADLAGLAAADLVGDPENPVEIVAHVNGYDWHLLIPGADRDRRFAANSASIDGLSKAAWLAAPYAPARTYIESQALNAQQLADQELTNTGWTLDWGIPAWLVPAGVWSYQGLTPIQAIARICEAAGAYVHAARDTQDLLVRPRYPSAPWNWAAATPDVTLPADFGWQEGRGRSPRTAYNAVYVMGQTQGVLALVKETGTAGDVLAQQVVDPLITHVDAARARGLYEIARSRIKTGIRLNLPLLAPPAGAGLILPGTLLALDDVEDWRGLVTGTRVEVSRQNDALHVVQSLEVAIHA